MIKQAGKISDNLWGIKEIGSTILYNGNISDIVHEDNLQVGDVSVRGHFLVGSRLHDEARRIAAVIRHDLGIADDLRLIHSEAWEQDMSIYMHWLIQNKHGKNFTLLGSMCTYDCLTNSDVAEIAQLAADYFRQTQ